MISAQWDAPDFDDDQPSSDRAAPTLVSLHFVRSALRRRWLVCVLSAVIGLLIAAGLLVAFPAVHDAKAALILAHQPEDEPSQAMATDVSLLETRTLAEKAVTSLGLTMTPDDFLKTVIADPVSSELLSITLTAPNDIEAVRRLGVLTSLYLDFRGEQLSLQSNVYIQGVQQRTAKLQSEVGTLSQKIEQLSAAGSGSASKLSDAIAQRAFIQGRIDTLQQEIEDVTLQTTSVVSSSRVIDPAAVEPHAAKRRIALALASGFIGGAALGCGMVLFFAITSDRLRRRSDVADALEVPVPVSVRRIAPLPKRLQRLPFIRTLDGHRTAERLRLAHAIVMELPEPGRSGRLAVLCMDNAAEVRFAVATAAADLVADGRSAVLMDLTSKGHLDGEVVRSMIDSAHRPTVLRPRGLPTLAGDMSDLRVLGAKDATAPSGDGAAITLVLADFDPSVGADYLFRWTDRVIIAVTAGRSSAEMVRTAGDLVRSTGLELRVAALLHSERADNSSGTTGFDRPIYVVENRDRLALVGTTVAATAATASEEADDAEVAALQESVRGEETAADNAQRAAEQVEQPADEELTAHEDSTQDNEPASEVEQTTVEEEVAEEHVQLTDMQQLEQLTGEQLATEQVDDQGQLAEEEQLATQQLAEEEQLAAEQEQPAAEKAQLAGERAGRRGGARHRGRARRRGKSTSPRQEHVAKEEALAEEEHEQLAKEEYVAEEEQLATQELTTLEQPGNDEELEQLADEEQLPDEEQPKADKDQLTVEREEPTASEKITQGDELSGGVKQSVDDDQTVEMLAAVELEPVEVGEQVSVDQEQAAVKEHRSENELAIEDATLQMAAVEEALADDGLAVEDDATVQMAAVEGVFADEKAAAAAEPGDEIRGANGWQVIFLENPLVQVGPSPEDDELDWTWNLLEEPSSKQDSDSFVEIDPDSWALYIDVYPPLYLASTLGFADELNWNWDWDWDEQSASNVEEPNAEASNGDDSNGMESNGNGNRREEAQDSAQDHPAQANHRSSRV
jgi:capsular polysaccharide biosynthesis protein